MKKRMLITTIVMMLVLAVALTTSSLAWFSATQDTVKANSGTFQATTANGANVNIAISKSLQGFGTTVDMKDTSAKLIPVCLQKGLNLAEPTEITEENPHPNEFATVYFNGAKISNGNFVLDSTNRYDTSIAMDSQTDNDDADDLSTQYYYYDSLYIVNYDDTVALKKLQVKLIASVSNPDASVAVPVCLFRLSRRSSAAGTDANAWKTVDYYVVVLTPNTGDQKYTVYNIKDLKDPTTLTDETEKEAAVRAMQVANATMVTDKINGVTGEVTEMSTTMSFDFGTTGLAVNHGEFAKLDVLMWYDGAKLTPATASSVTNFRLEIKGDNSTTPATPEV